MRKMLIVLILFFPVAAFAGPTKDLIIKVPESFTDEQCDFILNSAINQIEAEIKAELSIPAEDIAAAEAEVDAIRDKMNLQKPARAAVR